MTNSFSKMIESYLNNKRVPELKTKIKELKIHVKGGISKLKKNDIIDVLYPYYIKCGNIINRFVNKYYMSFLKIQFEKLHKEFYENRKLCINDTDCYTLEPLNNIPKNQFCCIEDKKGIYYGFSIFSFQQLLPAKGSRKPCLNPYTREIIDNSIQEKIIRLIRLIKLIEPDLVDINKEPIINTATIIITNEQIIIPPVDNVRFLGNVIYPRRSNLNENQLNMIEMLIEKRKAPMDRRVEELFYEIDYLGNYTRREWFDQLEREDYISFFKHLLDFWHDGNIQQSFKMEVCTITGDPFYNILIHNFNHLSKEQIKEACLLVMENLTFTGKDDETRKIGVLYILLNLSYVSENVRTSINWTR